MSSLLTTDEAAIFLRLKPDTLVRWRSNKKRDLPYVKIGRSIRYKLSELEEYVMKHRQTTLKLGDDK